jgi:regulatory protein spx
MAWLDEHNLSYEEVNLVTDEITTEEILQILSLTENGTEEIISKRSKSYGRLNLDFDELSIGRLLSIVKENRTLLRRPLIIDEKRLQVGYNEDDIRKFLPRSVRTIECQTAGEAIKADMHLQSVS